MCKWDKNGNKRIDPCMREFIGNFNAYFSDRVIILACCCGHKKYDMTLIVKERNGTIFDFFSGVEILRKRRFYKKDKEEHYYIPEVI